ncbi:hypothetical protein J27TS8_40130 [Robertmurraya siralis]|uniref:Uncharacterized protein n=1 Tax=Robertmurraya siralis TaxID=77777 RepID=A0A919WKY8_9BACI|nr:hypothetical protein [Robertmurraya siralis]PAE19778.1 hypothetical protein CHH80_14650 [Bacillus sp. 7504-2]GIN64020.1 hypothetical protein J27TS8_40130 [Robertmurraya siralis]
MSLLLEKKKKTYRLRMIEAFDKGSFICPHCHREMDLVEVWHADYGFIYHYMENMESIKTMRRINLEQKQRAG